MPLSIRSSLLCAAALALPLAGCKNSDKHAEPAPYDGGPYIPYTDDAGPPVHGDEPQLMPIPQSRSTKPRKAPPAPPVPDAGGGGQPLLPLPSAHRTSPRRHLPAEGDRALVPVAAREFDRSRSRSQRETPSTVQSNRADARAADRNPVQLEGIVFVELIDAEPRTRNTDSLLPVASHDASLHGPIVVPATPGPVLEVGRR